MENYPGLQVQVSGPVHRPPWPHPPVQTGVQYLPSGLRAYP